MVLPTYETSIAATPFECIGVSLALLALALRFSFVILLSTQYRFPSKNQDNNNLLHELLIAWRTARRTHADIHSEVKRYITALFAFAANGRQRAAFERETRTVYRLKLNVTLWRRRVTVAVDHPTNWTCQKSKYQHTHTTRRMTAEAR